MSNAVTYMNITNRIVKCSWLSDGIRYFYTVSSKFPTSIITRLIGVYGVFRNLKHTYRVYGMEIGEI